MPIDDLSREYKESYQAELAMRIQLNSAIGLPISLISLYCGAMYFFVSRINQPWSKIEFIQVILFLVVVGIVIYAVYCLIRSYLGYKYQFAPTPTKLEEYRQKLKEKPGADEISTREEILRYVYSLYETMAHINAKNNEKRSDYLFTANRLIVIALPIVILIGFVQFASQISILQLKRDLNLLF